jgi:hypothetical protein
MIKKRYFAGLLKTQANWLNKMSAQGYRLTEVGMLDYTFAACTPSQYRYHVEYVGHLSWKRIQEYKAFLEEMGYRVWYKNINLNYSTGKIYWRPGAEKGGRIGTSDTTLNKELLIVEKPEDGTPFQLHTTLADQLKYTKQLCTPWLCMVLLFLVMGIVTQNPWLLMGAAVFLVPVSLFLREILSLSKESKTRES